MDSDSDSDSQIKEFYQLKNIAVVGVSKNEEKPSHQVPKYLIEHGYNGIRAKMFDNQIVPKYIIGKDYKIFL
jgi:uncharacterized protein